MVHHSSIFAWEIPWTEKPGYSPWGHKKVRHNLATKEQQYFQRQIKIFCKVLLYSEKKILKISLRYLKLVMSLIISTL